MIDSIGSIDSIDSIRVQVNGPFPLENAVWQDVFYIWWSVLGVEYIQAGDTLVPDHILSKKLYPNPATDRITVEAPSAMLPARLRIFDAQGRHLAEQELHGSRTEVSLANASDGALLFVQVVDKKGQVYGRVLVR